MINYNYLEYLVNQKSLRELRNNNQYCYITSKLTVQYKNYPGIHMEGTLENVLSNELPSPSLIKYILRWQILTENLVEYKLEMPVEIFPYFMQVYHEIEYDRYPFSVIQRQLVYQHEWRINDEGDYITIPSNLRFGD